MQQSIESSNKIAVDDPKYLAMAEKYAEKYAEKSAHEENDVTVWSGIGVVLIHALIVMGSVATVYYLPVSRMEQLVLSVLVVSAALVLEVFKSKYMERYFMATLKAADKTLSIAVRNLNVKRKDVSFRILMCFWGVSVVIFSFGSVKYAQHNAPKTDVLRYDETLKAALTAKTAAMESARKSGAGGNRLRQLGEEQTKAMEAWQSHKAQIDGRNDSASNSDSDDTWTYILMAIVACLGLELALYGLRRFHEGEQYKAAASLSALMNSEMVSPTPLVGEEMISKRLFDELVLKYNKFMELTEAFEKGYENQVKDLSDEVADLKKLNGNLERLLK